MKKLVCITFVLAAAIMALTACGQNDGGGGSPSPTPPPPTPTAPFILLADDGAMENAYKDIGYMGSVNNGDDGSMSVKEYDTSQKKTGNASMRFTYASPGKSHWAGMALLFETGWKSDPGSDGPDLGLYSEYTFWVKGSGGTVKFFIECDGGAQSTKFVTVEDEWQQVTLNIKDSWKYCNIMFGWACNESNPDVDGGTIEFWCDGMQFEE